MAPLSPRKWGGRTFAEALEAAAQGIRERPRDVPAFVRLDVDSEGPVAIVYWDGRLTEAELVERMRTNIRRWRDGNGH